MIVVGFSISPVPIINDTTLIELTKLIIKPISISQAINFYNDHFPAPNPVAEIIICGGGANFSQIDEVIAAKTKIPTKIGNPWLNILGKNQKPPLPASQSATLSTAIGLALRGLTPENL